MFSQFVSRLILTNISLDLINTSSIRILVTNRRKNRREQGEQDGKGGNRTEKEGTGWKKSEQGEQEGIGWNRGTRGNRSKQEGTGEKNGEQEGKLYVLRRKEILNEELK